MTSFLSFALKKSYFSNIRWTNLHLQNSKLYAVLRFRINMNFNSNEINSLFEAFLTYALAIIVKAFLMV